MVVEAEAVVRYGRAAQARRAAMDAWMWSDATGCWHDSWLNVPPAQLEDTHALARGRHPELRDLLGAVAEGDEGRTLLAGGDGMALGDAQRDRELVRLVLHPRVRPAVLVSSYLPCVRASPGSSRVCEARARWAVLATECWPQITRTFSSSAWTNSASGCAISTVRSGVWHRVLSRRVAIWVAKAFERTSHRDLRWLTGCCEAARTGARRLSDDLSGTLFHITTCTGLFSSTWILCCSATD